LNVFLVKSVIRLHKLMFRLAVVLLVS